MEQTNATTLNTEPQTSGSTPHSKRKRITLVVLIAATLLAAGVVACVAANANLYDQNASTLQSYSGSHDEIVAQLNEITRASQLWIAVAPTVQVDATTGTCEHALFLACFCPFTCCFSRTHSCR